MSPIKQKLSFSWDLRHFTIRGCLKEEKEQIKKIFENAVGTEVSNIQYLTNKLCQTVDLQNLKLVGKCYDKALEFVKSEHIQPTNIVK